MAGTNKPLIDPETGVIARGGAKGKTVEEVTDRYLARCEAGSGKKQPRMPTMVGLALEIGYAASDALAKYEREHCATTGGLAVKRARARLEDVYAASLAVGGNNQAGLIFSMKNMFNWRDKSDDELRQSVVITLSDEVSSAIERLAETLLGR